MGNFSRNTFDKLKHYVGVRLQQGVPLVDADWNEQEDIRKYELQSFLKWFVGDGVPRGNDGFRITPTPVGAENDFVIRGGDDTPEGAGRCLVDGWDVIIESDVSYTGQPLYENDALATAWNVKPVSALTTPAADRTDVVYLDVWEREVDSAEDDNLVNQAIGIETCVRRKREWVVRVAEDATTPPAPEVGHVHYPLALLNRPAGEAVITTGQIADLRLTGLAMLSYHDMQQIVTDAFGPDYTLDHDGQPNLKVSLREVINAILRRELRDAPGKSFLKDHKGYLQLIFEDHNGDIWAFWSVYEEEILGDRYVKARNGWEGNQTLSSDGERLYALEDSQGDIWVFLYGGVVLGPNFEVWCKTYKHDNGGWEASSDIIYSREEDEFTTGLILPPVALEDKSGDIWLFFADSGGQKCRRHIRDGDWEASKTLSSAASQPYVFKDRWETIWVFYPTTTAMQYHIIANGELGPAHPLTATAQPHRISAVLEDGYGTLWLFYETETGIWYNRFFNNDWLGEGDASLSTTMSRVLADDNGDILFFYAANDEVWFKRYHRAGDLWEEAEVLTQNVNRPDFHGLSSFSVLKDSREAIWLFWQIAVENPDDPGNTLETILYKKFYPTI